MEGWRRQPDSWILPCRRGKVEREASCGRLELETRVKFWWWFIGLLTQTGLIFLKSINSTHRDLRVPFISTTLSFLPLWCSFTGDSWRLWMGLFFHFFAFNPRFSQTQGNQETVMSALCRNLANLHTKRQEQQGLLSNWPAVLMRWDLMYVRGRTR